MKIQIDVMAEIAAEQKNIDQLNQQIEERSLANQEMRDNLANGTNEDYLRKKARERGYVYPDERVYIDITGE